MSKHKKSPKLRTGTSLDDKSPNGKKRNGHGAKELKQKTVAAETGGVGLREGKIAPMPSPVPPPPSAPAATKPAQAAPRPAPQAAKPAQAVPKPAPATVRPARAEVKAPKPPQPVLEAVETLERSFKAAGQGTVAVNRKLIDFAQANLNSSLDHVKDLAAARSPVRIMRLQMEYWHDCLETFASQAQELRALSAELVAKANEPIRQHVRSLTAGAA
jgi:hypothetical protein